MERAGLVLVLAVGILSTSAYGYQLPGRKFFSETTDKARNFVGKQKQNNNPLNIPDNAYPVQNSDILFPCREDGLFAYPQDCTLGVSCSEGESQVFTCTDIFHFNNVTKECDNFCSAHCDPMLACMCGWDSCERNFVGKQKLIEYPLNIPENAYPVQNSDILFPCREDGLFAYPQDCTLGVSCSEGESQVFTCTDIFHFNNVTKKCDNFCSAHCDPMLACSCGWDSCERNFVGKQKQNDYPLNIPDNAYPVQNSDISFPCREDGLFAYPQDCTLGVSCSEGESQVFTCTDIFHFNNVTKQCDNFCSAHCDPMLACMCGWDSCERNFVGKQKQNDYPLNIPDNAYPVQNSDILFPCHEDGLFAYPQDCTLGVSCSEGESQVFTCTDIFHFNNVTKKCDNFCSAHCDPMLACSCGWDSCETSKSVLEQSATDKVDNKVETLFRCIKDGLYPDPKDCNQFIQCSNDRAFFIKCPSGLHFSRERERCERPEDAACDRNLQMSSNSDDETEDHDGEKFRIPIHCPLDGLFASREHCNQYYKCFEGKLVFQTCSPGLHFNKRTKTCDTPCEAKCDPKISCPRQEGESLPTEIPVATSSQSSKKFFKLKVAEFVCPDDGLFPNPKNCSKYINCSNGNAYELTCPPSRHYNNETKQCETFCSAKCAPNLVCDWRHSMLHYEVIWDDICNNTDETYFSTIPRQCDKYYFCDGGEMNKFRCPDGLHFNGNSSRCQEPCDARCDFSLAEECGFEDSTEVTMNFLQQTCVKGKKNFLYRHYYECKYSFKCEQGEVSVVRCPDGQHTNNKTLQCQEPCEARCDSSLAEQCGWENETTESGNASTEMSPREDNETGEFDNEGLRFPFTCPHGDFYSYPRNCSMYYECSYGRLVLGTCYPGYHFNRWARICDTPCEAKCDPSITCQRQGTEKQSTTDEIDVKEEKNSFRCIKDGLYPDPKDCNQFIQCSNDRAFFMKCPSGLHFSRKTKRCERPQNAACDQNTQMSPREDDETDDLDEEKPRISFTCPRDGLFASRDHCNQYYECSHGRLVFRTCRPGLHFNKRTKTCETPCKAKCDPRISCPRKRSENLQYPVATYSESSKKVFKHKVAFVCSENGLFPNPRDCSKYISCSKGNAYELSCPPSRHFNNKTKLCETLCSAKCDPNLICDWQDSMLKIEDAFLDICTDVSNTEELYYTISPIQCDIYYKCEVRELNKFRCPDGKHFRKETSRCEEPYDPRCNLSLDLSTETPVATTSESSNKVFTLKVTFVCSEDGLFPNTKDCSKYINCSNGNAYELSCPPSRHFNSKTKQCETLCSAKCDPNLICNWQRRMQKIEEAYQDICNDEVHNKEELYYLISPFQCDVYYKCEVHEFNKFRCPDGKHFSVRKDQCEEPCIARCDLSLAESCGFEDSTEGIIGRMQRNCTKEQKFYGIRRSHDCGKAFVCNNGEVSVFRCPTGRHISLETGQCEEPCVARCDLSLAEQCGWGKATTESTIAPTEMSPAAETSVFGNVDPRIPYTCHHGDRYPDHTRCDIYYECYDGRLFVGICYPGYHFNSKTKKCDTPCEAKCDPNVYCLQKRTKRISTETPVSEDVTSSFSTESSKKIFKLKVTFVCLDDGFFPHRRNCSKYINCKNGNAYEISCPPSRHFNNVTKQCETFCSAKCDPNLAQQCGWESTTATEIVYHDILTTREPGTLFTPLKSSKELCSEDGTYLERNPLDCNTYFKCMNGDADLLYCPDGQHFNPQNLRCEDSSDAQCDSTMASSYALTTHGPDVTFTPFNFSTELCSELGTYLEGNSLNCNSYFKCMNFADDDFSVIYFLHCPDGQHFNQQTLRCEDPCDAQCDSSMVEKCSWKYTTEAEKVLSNSLKQPIFDFECPGDGLYANTACETFIQCTGGQAYLINCPYGLHYEPYSERCTSPCEARCDSYYEDYCKDEEKHRARAPKHLLKDFDCQTDGYHTNPLDCGSFIQCFDGDAYAIYCPADLHYSPTLEICMSRCDAKCAPNYEEYCRAEEYNRRRKLQHTYKSSAKQPFPLVSEFICANDGDYPNPENCNSYITCVLGESFYKDCPEGLHFSEQTQRCELPCEARCQSSLACECDWDTCGEVQETSEEVDCEAEFDEGTCRGRIPRYAYDAWSGRCRGFFYGGCGGNSNNFRTIEECENKCQKKLLRGFRCPADNGMFGNYPDCLSYYQCKRGVPFLKKCPDGKAFDHKKSKCVTEYEATCVYECRDRDAVYPYEEDCRKYIDCVNGISKLERCPSGKAFDPHEKDCIDEKQVETCFWE